MDNRKVWFVKHPLSLYEEDVKKLAAKNELNIIDVRFKDSIDKKLVETKTPKLTLLVKVEVESSEDSK